MTELTPIAQKGNFPKKQWRKNVLVNSENVSLWIKQHVNVIITTIMRNKTTTEKQKNIVSFLNVLSTLHFAFQKHLWICKL